MKEIKILNKNIKVKVDNSDFEYLNQFIWYIRGLNYAGRVEWKNNISKTILMHREIMKAKPGELLDHVNKDTLDNRKKNLRFCSRSTNAMNCKIHKHNTSGYKGVSKFNNKWRAYIVKNNKQIYIGLFESKEKAAKAYNKKAKELFKEFASINKIGERK